MARVAWRNRVFGGTLKLRLRTTVPPVRERDRNISNAASTTADSYRVVVMLISHLPTPSSPAQSDPSSPKYLQLSCLSNFRGGGIDLSVNSAYIFLDARNQVCGSI